MSMLTGFGSIQNIRNTMCRAAIATASLIGLGAIIVVAVNAPSAKAAVSAPAFKR